MNQCSMQYQYPGNGRQYVQSWAVSLLLHGLAVSSAVILLGDLKLEPQPEPFKWEVSLVQPTDQVAEAQPAQPESEPAPTPKPQARPKPVEPTPQPVQQQTIVKTVPPPVQQQPTQPVQQQIVRQPAQEPPPQEIKEVKPIVEAVPPAPIVDLVQQPTTIVSQPVESQKPVSESIESAVVAASPPAPPIPQHQAKAEPRPKDISTSPASVVEPPAVAKETPAPSAPHAIQAAPPVIQEASVRPHAAPAAAPPKKTDYGWLAKSLWDRVVHLKRYPHTARLNHLEGRVVVRAVIREDGHLAEAEVLESSGHDVLDLAALEIVRRAFPLKLAKDLGRAQMAVQVPITYKLEN